MRKNQSRYGGIENHAAHFIAICCLLFLTACGGSDKNSSVLAPIAVDQSTISTTPESISLANVASAKKATVTAKAAVSGATVSSIISTNTFADVLKAGETIRSVTICAGWYVDSLQFATNLRTLPVHGAPGAGNCHVVSIQAGDNISGIFGNAGSIVDSVGVITTNGNRYGPFGGKQFSATAVPSPGSAPYLIQVNSTEALQGFYGRAVTDTSLVATPLLGVIGIINADQGGGGGTFVDKLNPGETVSQVNICVNTSFVESVQMVSNSRTFTQRGGANGCTTLKSFNLVNGEQIVRMFGTVGVANQPGHYVKTIGFITDHGNTYGPYGNTANFNTSTCNQQNSVCTGFEETLRRGNTFRGLFGGSGWYLDNIHLVDTMAGGEGGTQNTATFNDQAVSGATVLGFQVCTGSVASDNLSFWGGITLVTGVRTITSLDSIPMHGSGQGTCTYSALNPGEYVTRIFGTAYWAMDQLGFITNTGRQLGPWGNTAASPNFVIDNPNINAFYGFSGLQSSTVINQIDFSTNNALVTPIVRPAPTSTATTDGWWDSLQDWYIIPVHTIVLSDGRVLSYGTDGSGTQSGRWNYDIWNPVNGNSLVSSHQFLPNTTTTDLFCGAQSLLPGSGKVLLSGGDNRYAGVVNSGVRDVNIFDPLSNQLTKQTAMASARWYNTQVTLPDGRVLSSAGEDQNKNAVNTTEVFAPATGQWKTLTGINGDNLIGRYYPRMFVLPDGSLLTFSTSGTNAIYQVQVSGNGGNGAYIDTGARLPVASNWTFPAAMYQPGKIIVAMYDGSVALIDATSKPIKVSLTSPLSQVRSWGNFTLLPTGEVLATGGSAVSNTLTGVAYSAEIWNPQTGKWRLAAKEDMPRLYHNNAILLQDGRVISAGGGAPGPMVNTNAQAYSPYYLFQKNGNGSLATRPVISLQAVKNAVAWGSTFNVSTTSAQPIQRVTLVRNSASTHSWNVDQRFVELTFSNKNGSLSVNMPANANIAPPGFYWLFVLDSNGVPSVAQSVRLGL
ncbi:jacalin-like lectin [Undibacterium sp. SXout20W]|uniref:jacalin-like lectin n=1 Tax=Undibacterium sp. SXout20W TaxID=3413051 RepID=UPI003BF3E4B5